MLLKSTEVKLKKHWVCYLKDGPMIIIIIIKNCSVYLIKFYNSDIYRLLKSVIDCLWQSRDQSKNVKSKFVLIVVIKVHKQRCAIEVNVMNITCIGTGLTLWNICVWVYENELKCVHVLNDTREMHVRWLHCVKPISAQAVTQNLFLIYVYM